MYAVVAGHSGAGLHACRPQHNTHPDLFCLGRSGEPCPLYPKRTIKREDSRTKTEETSDWHCGFLKEKSHMTERGRHFNKQTTPRPLFPNLGFGFAVSKDTALTNIFIQCMLLHLSTLQASPHRTTAFSKATLSVGAAGFSRPFMASPRDRSYPDYNRRRTLRSGPATFLSEPL